MAALSRKFDRMRSIQLIAIVSALILFAWISRSPSPTFVAKFEGLSQNGQNAQFSLDNYGAKPLGVWAAIEYRTTNGWSGIPAGTVLHLEERQRIDVKTKAQFALPVPQQSDRMRLVVYWMPLEVDQGILSRTKDALTDVGLSGIADRLPSTANVLTYVGPEFTR